MTLCVAVTIADGLVLGADSMTMLRDPETDTTKHYPNAEKVFELPNLPIVAMTYGLGAIGRRSIGTLIDEWAVSRPVFEKGEYTVHNVAEDLGNFIFKAHRQYREAIERDVTRRQDAALASPASGQPKAEYNPSDWTTGLVVGGYQPGSYFPWLYSWEEPERDGVAAGLACVREHEGDRGADGPEPGVDYWGDTVALDRIYRGLDPLLLQDVGTLLRPDSADGLGKALERQRWRVLFDGMPLQDAIDFAKFLLDLGCNFRRFSQDAPQIGGDADIVAVTRTRVFWPHRKPIGSALASVPMVTPKQS